MFRQNSKRLSDGFKGIINKINSSSPVKEGSVGGGEGEADLASPVSGGAGGSTFYDDEQLLIEDDGEREGFLCPICRMGFPSPDDLQSHYEINHASEIDTSQAISCSVCKMRFDSSERKL